MSTAAYLANLLLMLLLVSGLAVAALWLARRVRPGLGLGRRDAAVRLVDAVPLGATSRLAVVDFAGRRLLLAVSRAGVHKLAEADAPRFEVDRG